VQYLATKTMRRKDPASLAAEITKKSIEGEGWGRMATANGREKDPKELGDFGLSHSRLNTLNRKPLFRLSRCKIWPKILHTAEGREFFNHGLNGFHRWGLGVKSLMGWG
jgi:hypothetical protein